MHDVRDTIARTLTALGSEVQPVEPEGLEVVAPPTVREALGVGEFGVLSFGQPISGARRVTLEETFIDRLGALLADRGKALEIAHTERGRHWPSTPQRLLDHGVVLENATYRFRAVDTMARTRYLILVLRAVAISDERREDVFAWCVNESNGADADHLIVPALEYVTHLRARTPDAGVDGLPSRWSAATAAAWAARVMQARIRERIAPFLAGMHRRMGADLERLWTYYSRLRAEAAARMQRDDARRGGMAREKLRIEAIEREYASKIEELKTRYSMRVSLEVVQALRLITPVCRIEMDILRRKETRSFHLDWNPLSRQLDTLPCEGCGIITHAHLLCDRVLHLVCRGCLAVCAGCGKEYCRACHPRGCPRC